LKLSEKNKPEFKYVLIGIGSNLFPEQNIKDALYFLGKETQIIQKASIWKTPAVGSDGPDYFNSAVLVKTDLSLEVLKLNILSVIEDKLGRIRTQDKYTDRTIDLDILIYDQVEIDSDLWSQAHVAVPASQITPEFQNQKSGENLSQAARRLLSGTQFQEYSSNS